MSKKLSQAEIDALVASLISGEGTPEEGASDEQSGEEPKAEAKPEDEPAQAEGPEAELETPDFSAPADPGEISLPAAGSPAPPVGLTPETMPFELIQDLGPVTQSEVDAAIEAYHKRRMAITAAPAAAAAMAPSAPAPVEAPPPPTPAEAQAAPVPVEAPAASTVSMPPSSADYAASQAQAAQQTRKALSMAALSSVLMDIELTVTVELGRARLSLGDVLSLGPGSVITLDKQANTPVDVLVNHLPLMKAEVLAIAEKYGVRITKSNLNVKAAS
ncbi:MAG: FliM/FliN family flagellar motor switch protein [Bacillota bacterium]